jgi:hypothetical protein
VPAEHGVVLLPVIFTTANLWTSDIDISAADLGTGQLPATPKIRPAEWLYYQYPVSPSMKHQAIADKRRPPELEELLEPEFLRTIVIVSATATAKFLKRFTPEIW